MSSQKAVVAPSAIQQVPPLPSTPTELVNTLAHYHRAEIGRMAGWRDRIDRTSNWAITVAAAMLSVSLSTPASHHGVLLFAMLLILLLLWIEARRYRFFDVYRARVRQFERNYFAQILAPGPEPDNDWARILGESLRHPEFLISHAEAMSRRLRRNYIWMYLILLLAWILKISSPQLQEDALAGPVMRSFEHIIANAALGPVPGWLVCLAVASFYGWLLYAAYHSHHETAEMRDGHVHV